MKTLHSFVLGLFAAGSLLSTPALAQQQLCPSLEALVDAALPAQVGDAAAMRMLLAPPATGRLSQVFQPDRAISAVRDSLKPEPSCPAYAPITATGQPFSCVYSNSTGSKLRVDLGRGRIAYRSKTRSEAADPNSLPPSYAMELATQVAASYGIPTAELSVTEAQVRGLRLSSLDGSSGERSSYRAEHHVRYPRRVGGTLVPDSGYHVAVDARGQVARLHVRWPDFQLAPGLSLSQMRSRSQVRDQLIADISAHNACGSVAAVKATVAYLPMRRLEQGGGRDEEALSTGQVSQETYAPGLLVGVVPAEPADPEEFQAAGEELWVPLLGNAAL
jgi:hypothetical protein